MNTTRQCDRSNQRAKAQRDAARRDRAWRERQEQAKRRAKAEPKTPADRG